MWSLRDKGIKGLTSMVFKLFSGGKTLINAVFSYRYTATEANTKGKSKIKHQAKNEILRSLVEDGIYQDEQLNKRADELTNYEEVIPIVKEYKKVIQS